MKFEPVTKLYTVSSRTVCVKCWFNYSIYDRNVCSYTVYIDCYLYGKNVIRNIVCIVKGIHAGHVGKGHLSPDQLHHRHFGNGTFWQ